MAAALASKIDEMHATVRAMSDQLKAVHEAHVMEGQSTVDATKTLFDALDRLLVGVKHLEVDKDAIPLRALLPDGDALVLKFLLQTPHGHEMYKEKWVELLRKERLNAPLNLARCFRTSCASCRAYGERLREAEWDLPPFDWTTCEPLLARVKFRYHAERTARSTYPVDPSFEGEIAQY